jgi:hypothetical protein
MMDDHRFVEVHARFVVRMELRKEAEAEVGVLPRDETRVEATHRLKHRSFDSVGPALEQAAAARHHVVKTPGGATHLPHALGLPPTVAGNDTDAWPSRITEHLPPTG